MIHVKYLKKIIKHNIYSNLIHGKQLFLLTVLPKSTFTAHTNASMTQQGRVQKSVGSKGPKSRMSWTRLDHNPSEPEPEPARQWSRLNKNQNHSWTATQGEQNLAGTEPKNEKESTRDQKQSGTRNVSSLPLHTKKVTITMWTTKEQHVAISHCPIRALWSTPTNRWS